MLTETWIKSQADVISSEIENYHHYYNFRNDRIGGGVSIYVHNSLNHNLIEDHYVGGNNYLWIHLQKYCIDVGVVYKPGDTKPNEFLEVYENQLQKTKRALIFGDFNFDLLKPDKTTIKYKETLKGAGFKILNKIDKLYCTRDSTSCKTILDHSCSNLKNEKFLFSIIDSPLADHKQIYLELKKFVNEKRQKLQYSAIDYSKLFKSVESSINTLESENYENLNNYIKDKICENKVEKIKYLNQPQDDWIDKTIMNGIRERNELWRKLKQYPKNTNLHTDFINKRNWLSKTIKKTKHLFYKKAFNKCINKPKKMWSLINELTKNKQKRNSIPAKIIVDGKEITNEKEICDCFNNYFSTIGSTLANQIPPKFHNNNINIITNGSTNTTKLSKIELCTTSEINKIIDKLDPNTSTGIDGISAKSIKCIKKLVLIKLTRCLNNCLEESRFPECMKLAKVVPIFKSGNKSTPGDYRPVSVLPMPSKILERVLYNRLESHLIKINFLSNKQYGFRPKSNTLSATVDLVTEIKLNIDNKKIALGVFIDLKKAFDTVSHSILLQKLNSIGIVGNAHKIFESYLNNRQQLVKFGSVESASQPVDFGVPQGSILGPLLFLIYVNNINTIGLHGKIALYADDTCLFYFGHSIQQLITQAQEDLDKLNMWFQYNLLTINASKTCYIIFSAKNKKIQEHDDLKINGEIIHKSNEEKYLGLILDSKLTWKTHIDKIRKKLISLMGAMRGIVGCLPKQVRYTIYNSLVKPHLEYLIEIWGSACKTYLKQIQIAQNKIIKVLFHYDYLESTSKIYKETKLMHINQIFTFKTCVLIYKILNKSIHSNLTLKKRQHKYNTRSANLLTLIKTRTNYGTKSLVFQGAQMYNKLPKIIKESKSLPIFKKLLKQHIITQIKTIIK